MAEIKKTRLTQAGFDKLVAELEDLKVNKRKEIADKIKEARAQGDLSENAEYDAAKDEQSEMEGRIEEIEQIMKNHEIVTNVGDGRIGIGCKVLVKDIEMDETMELNVVGSSEANPLEGFISDDSPVGKALSGKKAGDKVEVETPAGVIEYEILRANQRQNSGEQDLNQLLKIRREKLKTLQEEGKDPFRITTYDQTEHSTDIKNHFEEMEGKEVSIAGRMMSKRVMGKASFCDVLDRYDSIQVYVARDQVGEDSYKDFKKYDIGDIIGVKGTVFRTKMGEISVHADQVTLLSKNLVPLPEKFHGLQDTDIRYRQRYLDLIMNRDVRATFEKRSQIIKEIRNFLDKRDFMEVETPMLVENAGGAAARPFVTHYNALDEDVKLRISLELYLKRLIVGGFERVYEIGRVFRNEGVDTRHNPEFTLMELYQSGVHRLQWHDGADRVHVPLSGGEGLRKRRHPVRGYGY